jgi:hypothetical protein
MSLFKCGKAPATTPWRLFGFEQFRSERRQATGPAGLRELKLSMECYRAAFD